jgi:hypothetical protein
VNPYLRMVSSIMTPNFLDSWLLIAKSVVVGFSQLAPYLQGTGSREICVMTSLL